MRHDEMILAIYYSCAYARTNFSGDYRPKNMKNYSFYGKKC